MNYINQAQIEWQKTFETQIPQSLAFRKLSDGSLNQIDYREITRQVYHNSHFSPKLMCFALPFFKGKQKSIVRTLMKHALAETGHDIFAKNDFGFMGGNTTELENERLTPAVLALNGALTYLVQFESPLCLLGYMYHLEMLPSVAGKMYIEKLKNIGVPMDAMSFIIEHAEVDPAHVKLMEMYFQAIESEEDFQHFLYGMRVTAELYGRVMDEALRNAQTQIHTTTAPMEA